MPRSPHSLSLLDDSRAWGSQDRGLGFLVRNRSLDLQWVNWAHNLPQNKQTLLPSEKKRKSKLLLVLGHKRGICKAYRVYTVVCLTVGTENIYVPSSPQMSVFIYTTEVSSY